MKKVLLVCVLSSCLFSCSLLQRRGGGPEEEPEAPAVEASGDPTAPLFTASGQEVSATGSGSSETEVSRLNTKVAALETKLDVLSASMERMQAQKSQPIIQAESRPQQHLAAPVDEAVSEIEDQTTTSQVSAAPAKPAQHTAVANSAESDSPLKMTGAEREFRAGMQLFQNGQNLEAASRFALMAKKFPHHMLAAHALYWAGEASARGQQWAIAVDNWSELERKYPRTAYMPEALAGLAKAYEAQGDATKSKYYRTVLLRAFPKSPVAMRSETEIPGATTAPARKISRAANSATQAVNREEEMPPTFEEENNGSQDSGAGANSESQ